MWFEWMSLDGNSEWHLDNLSQKLQSLLSLIIWLQSDSQMILIVDTKPKSTFFYSLNIYN